MYLSPSSGERFYRPELDLLRFFAFLAVFFVHQSPDSILPVSLLRAFLSPASHLPGLLSDIQKAGVFGVDLFFVLSAYLITELLMREKAARGFLDVKAFYVRRILRIWPLYVFFIGVAWVLNLLVAGQNFTWKYALAFLLLSGNWICALHSPLASVAGALWSVSIEEQFYLLWPGVVRRASAGQMAAVAAGLLVMASVVRFVLLTRHASMAMLHFNTFTRIDGIAVGILLSLALRGRIPVLPLPVRLFSAFLGVGVLVGIAHLLRDWSPNGTRARLTVMLGFPMVCAGCALLFLSVLGLPLGGARLVNWFRLVYLGKISYGLYVYHILAIAVVHQAVVRLGAALKPLSASLSFLLTVVLASASYKFLELPFLKLKEHFTHVPSRPA